MVRLKMQTQKKADGEGHSNYFSWVVVLQSLHLWNIWAGWADYNQIKFVKYNVNIFQVSKTSKEQSKQ